MSRNRLFVCAALFLGLGLALPGFATEPTEPSSLELVPAVKVCMVNDMLFERDQIPVEVDGKTYYGCCEMCKERLAQDAAIRTAKDPLTGAEVDKATAVMAARPDGSILYFESEENLETYRGKKAPEDESASR